MVIMERGLGVSPATALCLLLVLSFGGSFVTASLSQKPSVSSSRDDGAPAAAWSSPKELPQPTSQTDSTTTPQSARLVPPSRLQPTVFQESFVVTSSKERASPLLPSQTLQNDSSSKTLAKRLAQASIPVSLMQAGPAAAAVTTAASTTQTLPASAYTETTALRDVWWSTVDRNDSAFAEMATENRSVERFAVLKLDFQKVATPFFISFWILIASIAKIGFHLSRKLSSVLPESSLLIVLGIAVGIMFFYSTESRSYHMMDADTFFYFLLPPIILESGYFMPNRAFFDNIGTILLYAIVGTLFNAFAIGLSLWGLAASGAIGKGCSIPLLHCLLFSSLVSAVDPVAVLAVFEEIQVNQMLHIIVFGESLLNDAVTVVLHHIFEAYSYMGNDNIQPIDVVAGIAAFFVVGIGGTITGVLFGFLGAFVTKYTSHVRVIEPIFIFLIAYLSYLSAESFHFSGIVALTFCGMIMKRYAEPNISEKSQTTVKYFMKMLSSVSETIIFLFLGTSTVMDSHAGNAVFIIMTIVFCLLYRAIGVVFLTAIVNRYRLLKLSFVDQFVMSYSGLRGAVAFALAITLDSNVIATKNLFVTTTMAVILFTVFIQGTTVKPLVNTLRVKRQNKEKRTMNKQINGRMIHHIMGGIEEISGIRGNHWLRHRFEYYDSKYFQRYLLRDRPCTRETAILRVSSKLCQREAMEQAQKPLVINRVHGIGGSMNDLVYKPTQFRLNRNLSEVEMLRSPTLEELEAISRLAASGTVVDMHALEATGNKKMADDCKIHHILPDPAGHPGKKWSKKRKRPSDAEESSDLHVPSRRHHRMFRLHLRHPNTRQHLRHQQSYGDAASAAAVATVPCLDKASPTVSHDHCDDGVARSRSVTFSEAHLKAKLTSPTLRPNGETPVPSLPYQPGGSDTTSFERSASSEGHPGTPAGGTTNGAGLPGTPAGGTTNGAGLPGTPGGGKIIPIGGNGVCDGSSTPVGGLKASEVPTLAASSGSVANHLPWRQTTGNEPELSYKAQFKAPSNEMTGGGLTLASTIAERSSLAAARPRFELYPNEEANQKSAHYTSGSRLMPAGGALAPSLAEIEQPSIREISKARAEAVADCPRAPLARLDAVFSAEQCAMLERDVDARHRAQSSRLLTTAAEEETLGEDEKTKFVGDITSQASEKLYRDKNSNERPDCRSSWNRERTCDSGDEAGSLLGMSLQPR